MLKLRKAVKIRIVNVFVFKIPNIGDNALKIYEDTLLKLEYIMNRRCYRPFKNRDKTGYIRALKYLVLCSLGYIV